MVDGFWIVQFEGLQGGGGGVAVLTKGQVFGGDSAYTYTGTYQMDQATLKVESGRHEITLHKQFYRDANVVAKVKEGETFNFAPAMEQEKSGGNPFHAIKGIFGGQKIPAGKGVAQIKSKPSGAEVVYKGTLIEQRTPLKVPLDPGTYRVRVKLDGYRPQEKDFTVVQGKTTDVNVELQPK